MSEAITNNRREKRKASGKGISLLGNLEDDFSDIEANFRHESIQRQDVRSVEPGPTQKKTLVERKQSVSKALVEREQSVSKALVEREQSVSKALVEREQKNEASNKKTESVSNPLVSALGSPLAEALVEREQIVSRALVKCNKNTVLSDLSKQQNLLLNYIFEICSSMGQRETPKIQNHILLNYVQTSQGNLRVLILGLKHMNFLNVLKSKNGPSGWRIFELPEEVYKQLSAKRNLERALAEREQTVSKALVNALARPLVESPSSSSINITTTNYKADALGNSAIQLTENLTSIGFNQGHIDQLLRDSSLSSEEIQNSLHAFAFDLGFEDVKRKVRSPIGLIMKLLKNGQAYISEKGYESEEDRLYRELIERAEKKKEEKLKLESRMAEIKFEEWLENISDEEKRNIVEPVGEFMGLLHRQELKEYFKREVCNA